MADANPYRALPSVDALLETEAAGALMPEFGRAQVRALLQGILDAWRERIRTEGLDGPAVEAELQAGAILRDLAGRAAVERRAGLRPVINVSGVVLNTGLG
ncbi:MAG: L-seryl-tRNA(Sec) selenium transferase, partial [Planctomycetota bacterium]